MQEDQDTQVIEDAAAEAAIEDSSPETTAEAAEAAEVETSGTEGAAREETVSKAEYDALLQRHISTRQKLKGQLRELRAERDPGEAPYADAAAASDEPDKIDPAAYNYDPAAIAKATYERERSLERRRMERERFRRSMDEYDLKSEEYAEANPDYRELMEDRGNAAYSDRALNRRVIEKGDPAFDHYLSLPENAGALRRLSILEGEDKARYIGKLEARAEYWAESRKAGAGSKTETKPEIGTKAPRPIRTEAATMAESGDWRYSSEIDPAEYRRRMNS